VSDRKTRRTSAVIAALACSLALQAQEPVSPQPVPPQAPAGKVLFSTDHPPAPVAEDPDAQAVSSSQAEKSLPGPPDSFPKTPVTQAERSAILITARDLDLHLTPAEARIEAHATITLRNLTDSPLTRIPLQISSTLRFQTISSQTATGLSPVAFTQSPIATDTDHTGYAQEAVITPAQPLPPGVTLSLSVFYLGQIRQSGARLELLGTDPARAAEADWDQIAQTSDLSMTALRGFGNVLWYPVAAPTAVLGDGNKLLTLTGRIRLAESPSTIRLRLAVDYLGDAPVAALFNGVAQPLIALPDEQDQLVTQTHGIATTEFPVRTLGFRSPSLFLTAEQPVVTENQTLSAITANPELLSPYKDAVAAIQPLLSDWFGVTPISPLTLLDHPGEPFEDQALLVTPLGVLSSSAPFVAPLTHAWFHSAHPWIEDGLADYMALLWTERTRGREAAIAELSQSATLIALSEPDLSPALNAGKKPDDDAGEPLTHASSPVYFRTKAAAVWWQLRDIVGDEPFRQALVAYRHSEASPTFDADPHAMQTTLERLSGKPLDWFFEDWVYHDRSLPDLTILEVNARTMPDRLGRDAGYLVAVEVRNEGDAVAEVPVTVRSGSLTATERLRVPARSNASTRIVFNGIPESIQVNDGTVPELRSSVHTREIKLRQQP
jgi:hypothetical protein